MVTTAALRLEIDARQMKQGAAEAAKAIVDVGEASKKTAREVKVNTEAIERKLDAIVEGMILHNNKLGESNMQLRKIAEGVEKSMVKAETSTQRFGREIHTVGGVADAVEKKFTALGKAAVGMFAADIAAKVLGFSSAMDVLNKTSQSVADEITRIIDGLRGMNDEWKLNISSGQRLFEIAARVRAEEERKKLVYSETFDQLGMTANVDIGFLSAYPEQFNAAAAKAAEVIESLRTAEEGYRISDEGGRIMMRDTAQMLVDGLNREILKAANDARIRATDVGGSAVARQGSGSGRDTALFAYEDFRRRAVAEDAAMRRAREIGINTSQTAREFGYGFGVTENRWDFGLGPSGGGGYQGSADTLPTGGDPRWDFGLGSAGGGGFRGSLDSAPRGPNANYVLTDRDRWMYGEDGKSGYIGALQNRYSPERIAEQFSANFYQSLEASVMTGDFSNFGRSVMQMIGQSLMESLVAAPIQEAMASLMQALLGGMRNGFGGGAGAVSNGAYLPAGGGPGAPAPIQAGGGSNSVAPYRSPKQRYDDFGRRNLR